MVKSCSMCERQTETETDVDVDVDVDGIIAVWKTVQCTAKQEVGAEGKLQPKLLLESRGVRSALGQ